MNIFSNLRLRKDNLIMAMLSSSVIGVGISYSDLYLFHIFLGLFLFISIFQIKQNEYKLNINNIYNNQILFLLVMFFWYGLSLIWAPDFELALKYIFYIFCGLSITLTLVYYAYSLDRLNKTFKILSLLFIIELIIALLESFTMFRMPISSYSSLVSYFGKIPVDFLAHDNFYLYSDYNPPTAFHWNTNNLAVAMIIILPFFLCSNKIITKLIGVVSITLITIMSASRAVFLALVLIYCLYLIVIKKKVGTLSLIWMITISLFWGMNQLKESANPRINEVANSFKALTLYLKGDIDIGGSLEWRRELVDNGLLALSKTNGLGLGAGGSTANQEQIGAVAGRFTSMHNFWIELLVEGGVVFSILMYFWYINMIYKLFILSKKKINSTLNYYSKSLLLSMIGFIPAAIAASSTIYFFPMWIMFGMVISVISVYSNELINSS